VDDLAVDVESDGCLCILSLVVCWHSDRFMRAGSAASHVASKPSPGCGQSGSYRAQDRDGNWAVLHSNQVAEVYSQYGSNLLLVWPQKNASNGGDPHRRTCGQDRI